MSVVENIQQVLFWLQGCLALVQLQRSFRMYWYHHSSSLTPTDFDPPVSDTQIQKTERTTSLFSALTFDQAD